MATPDNALVLNADFARSAGAELEDTTMALARRLRTNLALRSTADLEQAVLDRQDLGEHLKRIEQYFEAPIKSAHQTHKLLCDRRRELMEPLQKVDRIISTAISEYKAAKDREREAQEREQAEQRRKDEQTRAAAEAAALESQGQSELAASVLAEAIDQPLPAVVLPDVTKEVSGLKFRRYWRWRYANGPTDVAKTPGEIVARALAICPREFLMIDARKVSAYATAYQATGRIPGIQIYFVDEPVR